MEKIKLSDLKNKTTEYVQAMSRKKRIIAICALAGIVAFSIILSVLLNQTHYAALYSGLDASEAGKIMSVLEEDSVDAKMQGTGTILVPEDQVDELKVSLAAKGYPSTGLNYDLFTQQSEFGSTDVETQTRLQYTLQENIRTTIANMDKVDDCIVIVNLAKSSSYVVSSSDTKATAAVMLELEPGQTLSNEEARAIAQFVMKCVAGLEMDNISIVDSSMHSYDLSDDDDTAGTYSATQMELTEKMKDILSAQALDILTPALGTGNVAVTVNLALDFDKETENSTFFSAPIEGESEGMLRSLQESTDTSGNGTGANGSVGTDSNGVSGTQYTTVNGNGTTDYSNTKTYNYELNEVRTEIEKAQGKVSGMSVSVLINSNASGAQDAANQAQALVANAIGVEPQYITVSSLPFVEPPASSSFADLAAQNQSNLAKLSRNSLIRTILICATLLLAVFIVLRFLRGKKKVEETEGSVAVAAETAAAAGTYNAEETEEERNERLIKDLEHSKSGEMRKVEDLVENYPEAAVQILRNWLTDA